MSWINEVPLYKANQSFPLLFKVEIPVFDYQYSKTTTVVTVEAAAEETTAAEATTAAAKSVAKPAAEATKTAA